MANRALDKAGGLVLHLLNRSAKRTQLFFTSQDYRAFEHVLADALVQHPTRLLGYCVMPNHWHLVVWAINDEIPPFMHWLTFTHAKRWHEAHGTTGTGHVYQDRYRAIPVQCDNHLMRLLRYVERNPLRAQIVERAEDWQWSSLWRRCNSCEDGLLSQWPIPPPGNWLELVNTPQTQSEVEAIQRAITRNRPFGEAIWEFDAATQVGLSTRTRGRPTRRNQA
jgi:REP-associated tyrosine transposase